jgi:hypothetical protein
MMTKPTAFLYHGIVFTLATTPAYKKNVCMCGIGIIAKRDLAYLARMIESYS